MFALVLFACAIDNSLGTKGNTDIIDSGDTFDPPFDDAQLEASPASINEVACGTLSRVVTLASVGATPLTIQEIRVEGGGWTVDAPELPLTLPAGASVEVPVEGSGPATLVVVSDDENAPSTSINLQTTSDYGPSLLITSPGASATLDAGTTWFTATVVDDVDRPESLGITWTSSVDGVVGTDPAGSDGTATMTWDAALRTPGEHVVVLAAEDSCGNVSTMELSLCQQGGFVEDNIELESWNFVGNATWDATNSWLELTKPVTAQVASAFNDADTVMGNDVEVAFSFYVSGGSGADGISVTALDTDRMTGFIGDSGGSIGYSGLPGWSVEVDTYDNGRSQDPTGDDHVMFTFDGNVSGVTAWAALPEMEDGAWHTMAVEVHAPRVTVTIDGVAYIDEDISGYFDFPAYVGFTAATGSLTNYHLIDALEVTQLVCPE